MITITITGPQCTGKTVLASHIKALLDELGYTQVIEGQGVYQIKNSNPNKEPFKSYPIRIETSQGLQK